MDGNKKTFEKEDKLIEISMMEFGEKGYENASLNNILKKASMSKGAFYYRYKNKEDLYMNIIDIIIEEKFLFLHSIINTNENKKDIFEKLSSIIKAGMIFANENPNLNRFAETFIKESSMDSHAKIMERYYLVRGDYLAKLIDKSGFKSMDFIGDLIEEGYEKGQIRTDLSKEFIKKIVSHMFNNLQEISKSKDINQYEEAANNLVEFIKGGIENRD